jgi:hypothetical protein
MAGSVAADGASASTDPGCGHSVVRVDGGGQSGRSRQPPPPVTKIRTGSSRRRPTHSSDSRIVAPLPSPCVHGPTTSATSAPRSRS